MLTDEQSPHSAERRSQAERRYGKVFDEVAADYDRHRPTYPDELVDRVCQVAGIGGGDRVLEVGCGSGQLTRSLVARGLDVTALEPGKHLVSLAEQNLEGGRGVEFLNARFEDAQLPNEHFQAVLSAAAFHWIDPEISWEKAARVLLPGGTLALMQHCGLQDEHSAADQEALRSAMARVAPEVAASLPRYEDLPSMVAGVEQRRENVSEVWAWIGNCDLGRADVSRLFGEVQVWTVPTVIEQTADELNALIRTTSLYARMSTSQQQAFQRESVAIYERLGRPIRSSTVAVLVTARRLAPVEVSD